MPGLETPKQRVIILCLLEIIFSECLHNQKPAITFVHSPYLLKAVPSFRRTIVSVISLVWIVPDQDKNYLFKIEQWTVYK